MDAHTIVMGLATVLVLSVFLASGQWVGMAMATAGVVILVFMVGGGQIAMVGRLQFNIANSFVLAAVPLFVMMGYVLIHSGLSDLVYRAVDPLVGFVPGGLLHTNVVAGSVFGAMCGTSVAGTAAVGSVAIPQMQRRGYDKALAYGSVAAGGTMSALIPPSLALIVYGAWVGESIGALFIAGVVPGIIMTALFMCYIAARALTNPGVAPRERVMLKAAIPNLVHTVPIFSLIFLILGSIYFGIATPTESASVGLVGSLLISLGYGRLKWQVVRKAALDSAQVTCMVMLLVVGAQFFAMGLAALRIPQELTDWLTALPVHRLVTLGLVMVGYGILGMFMEGTAIMLMTLPLAYPVITSLGFGSVWFGILVTVLIQVGLLTPPIGMDVFIVHKLSGETDMGYAVRGAMPFMLIMLAESLLLIAFPRIVTWLPSQMMAGAIS
jgi:tripartite ATP-independent transporter DctM subunit